MLTDRAEAIGHTHGRAATRSYLGIAMGTATPIDLHVDDWLKQSKYAGRSMTQHRQAIRELTAWCVASKSPRTSRGSAVR